MVISGFPPETCPICTFLEANAPVTVTSALSQSEWQRECDLSEYVCDDSGQPAFLRQNELHFAGSVFVTLPSLNSYYKAYWFGRC